MRYALDLDGVVAGFHEAFAKAASRLWPGRILAHVPPADKYYESLGLTDEEVNAVKEEIRATPNFWMHIPAIRENVAAVAQHRMEHPDDEIFYVTARHQDTTGMSIMAQSQRWTEIVGIGGLGTAVIVSQNKAQLYWELEINWAIDDDPSYITGFPNAFLLTQPWNQGYSGKIRRMESVAAFFAHTTRRAASIPTRTSASLFPTLQR